MANYWSIKKTERKKIKRDVAYGKAADKSVKMGADTPFDMGVGEDTPAYKKYEKLEGKIQTKGNKENKSLPNIKA
tara:strand:+ start:5083 stop:5307 length:225 start_codon:yes stop_codon:yes gene_type:complete